jgi:hypothetical protein
MPLIPARFRVTPADLTEVVAGFELGLAQAGGWLCALGLGLDVVAVLAGLVAGGRAGMRPGLGLAGAALFAPAVAALWVAGRALERGWRARWAYQLLLPAAWYSYRAPLPSPVPAP